MVGEMNNQCLNKQINRMKANFLIAGVCLFLLGGALTGCNDDVTVSKTVRVTVRNPTIYPNKQP
jgi:hypothetical protein